VQRGVPEPVPVQVSHVVILQGTRTVLQCGVYHDRDGVYMDATGQQEEITNKAYLEA